MTKREAKAVSMVKAHFPSWEKDSMRNTDEEILKAPLTQLIINAMQWQAEQCVVATRFDAPAITYFAKLEGLVLNAGTEEA